MTTSTGNTTSLWKILGVIIVVLLALALIGPLLKGLFWIAFIALAGYGAFVLIRRARSGPPSQL